jgi:hypothetical protein
MLEQISGWLGDWLSGAGGVVFIAGAVLLALLLDVSDEAARTDTAGSTMGWLRRRRTRRTSRMLRLALVMMLLGSVVATVVRILPAVA